MLATAIESLVSIVINFDNSQSSYSNITRHVRVKRMERAASNSCYRNPGLLVQQAKHRAAVEITSAQDIQKMLLALRTPRPTVTKTRLHRILRVHISSFPPSPPPERLRTVCCTTHGYLCCEEDEPSSSTDAHCILLTGDFNLILCGDICTGTTRRGCMGCKEEGGTQHVLISGFRIDNHARRGKIGKHCHFCT